MSREKSKDEIIAELLMTEYGQEELRRAWIRAFKHVSETGTPEESEVAQKISNELFGEAPEPWEENPYRWQI